MDNAPSVASALSSAHTGSVCNPGTLPVCCRHNTSGQIYPGCLIVQVFVLCAALRQRSDNVLNSLNGTERNVRPVCWPETSLDYIRQGLVVYAPLLPKSHFGWAKLSPLLPHCFSYWNSATFKAKTCSNPRKLQSSLIFIIKWTFYVEVFQHL